MEEKLYTYFCDKLKHLDKSEFFDQLKTNKIFRKEFVRLQNVYALTHLSRLSKNETEGKISFQAFMQLLQTKKRQKIIRLVMQYVAIVFVIISSTFFTTRFFLNTAGGNTEMNTVFVPAGQRAKLTLQDGTTVWLNAQSTFTYPARFSGNARKVSVSGEAYFDVADNQNKPFIVSTQDVEMKVLGTQFNVYSYPEAGYIQTDLVEGSLVVHNKQTPQVNITLKPNEQMIMKDGKMFAGKIESPDYFLWKDGIYTFDNKRLLEILEKLQLYYDVKIIVKDPDIFNVRYTGKFRQRDGIDEILKIIQKIRKFNIQKDIENNVITLTK